MHALKCIFYITTLQLAYIKHVAMLWFYISQLKVRNYVPTFSIHICKIQLISLSA